MINYLILINLMRSQARVRPTQWNSENDFNQYHIASLIVNYVH